MCYVKINVDQVFFYCKIFNIKLLIHKKKIDTLYFIKCVIINYWEWKENSNERITHLRTMHVNENRWANRENKIILNNNRDGDNISFFLRHWLRKAKIVKKTARDWSFFFHIEKISTFFLLQKEKQPLAIYTKLNQNGCVS